MRVVCDNCGASYKIPDSKLVKEVNHATCRKCGHRIVISRRDGPNTEPGVGEGGQGDGGLEAASTLINEGGGVRPPMRPPMGFGGADEVPAAIGRGSAPEPREATVPRDSAFAASMSARGNDAPTLPPPSGPTPQQLAAQQQQQAAIAAQQQQQAAFAAQQQAAFAAQQQAAYAAQQQQQLAMMNGQYPQNPGMTGAFPVGGPPTGAFPVGGPSAHQGAPLPAYPPQAAPMAAPLVARARPHDPAPDLSWV
ncbi:zinc-ribbon domain-containing protein, partial [Myxococcota bacterium]|nr:zinc-ribbon domain-containing protein [Myxococcota bacterium]